MPFADELIGADTALALARGIRLAAPDRPLPALEASLGALGDLPLRQRSDLLRDALLSDVDGTFEDLASVIRRAAAADTRFAGWLIWPVTSAVASRAVEDGGDAAFDDSMALLAELTSRLTSEFAIRSLLRQDLPRALRIISGAWVTSEDAHVRRLATEGTRPYLPWSVRVPALLADPHATVPILTALYRDGSEYVRRSVANHLNDLSRDHPALVVDAARAWLAEPDEHTEQVVGRGLRTLIRRGDPGALALLGFGSASLEVTRFEVDRVIVPIGGDIGFSADITNVGDGSARLSIDYVVHHRKANGLMAGKTFKLAVRTLEPGQQVEVHKSHSFRLITTRTYYPGPHALEVMINGRSFGRLDFELTP